MCVTIDFTHNSLIEDLQVWNQDLECLAKQHADRCYVVFNDDVNSNGLVFESIGENQDFSSSPIVNYSLLVDQWYEEGKLQP